MPPCVPMSHLVKLSLPYQWRIKDYSEGGGANSKIGCANILFCKFFAENCMKMKEFGPNRSLGFANARIESFLFFLASGKKLSGNAS